MSSLKAVKLAFDGQQIKLEQVDRLAYRNNDPTASSSDQRSNMLEALLRLKAKYDIKKDELISVNLNPGQVLGRYLQLPNSADITKFPRVAENLFKYHYNLEMHWSKMLKPIFIDDKMEDY